MTRYKDGRGMLHYAQVTLLHDNETFFLLCALGDSFLVFYSGSKILAALRRNLRAKKRVVLILQHIVSQGGIEGLIERLPYVQHYRLPLKMEAALM